jgi:hypothetical protein
MASGREREVLMTSAYAMLCWMSDELAGWQVIRLAGYQASRFAGLDSVDIIQDKSSAENLSPVQRW